MSLGNFIGRQFLRVIQWTEPGDGILSYRYPIEGMEIESGGQLTVRESQLAMFVNEGRIADVFTPGLHTLKTRNLPILTDLMNWDKDFESPFKSDVYFFSTHLVIDQKWGTPSPITLRDKEFGMVRLRAFGNYAYRLADPRKFFTEIAGTRDLVMAADLEGQLRTSIVAQMTARLALSEIPFLDMAANLGTLAQTIAATAAPAFAAQGLELASFVVESISLPEELEKVLNQRIGISMAGDLNRLTQFEAAEALEESALNAGGTAGMGVGLGAGAAMAQAILGQTRVAAPQATSTQAAPVHAAAFCPQCGKPLPGDARFCPACGLQL